MGVLLTGGHVHRIYKQAAHTHTQTDNCMLLTSFTHLLDSAGQLDGSPHLHLVNTHSHSQDNMLFKIHAEPEQMLTAPRTNTHNALRTGAQVPAQTHTRDPHRGSEISFLLLL